MIWIFFGWTPLDTRCSIAATTCFSCVGNLAEGMRPAIDTNWLPFDPKEKARTIVQDSYTRIDILLSELFLDVSPKVGREVLHREQKRSSFKVAVSSNSRRGHDGREKMLAMKVQDDTTRVLLPDPE
jgi:hypothetical protein